MVAPLFAQLSYDDNICPAKTPRQIKNEVAQKKLLDGLSKTFIYIAYLSYSDRTVDRPLTGPEEFEQYRGKMIRDVNVRVISPYGVSIEKPQSDHFSKFQGFANRIQMKTKDWVVRNDLLFKSGETVDPILFADTEKNLWERRTFKDVKIFLVPVEGSYELVDVLVMVQDKWSWGINTHAAINGVSVGLELQNFLGLPQSFKNEIAFNFRKDNLYTYSGRYQFENIGRSHIDTRISYQYENFKKGGKVSVNRDFFSANSKWAGHIQGAFYKESAIAPNDLGSSIATNTMYNWQDVWLAGSFHMPGALGEKYDLLRTVISGRMNRYQYNQRPYLHSPDGSQSFLNRIYFLGSIGFANWDYYLDHSVYYLDQAEYFSKGFNPSLILGFDYDEELQKRFYSGIQLDYGKYLVNAGYIDLRASYGGFTKKDSYQQILAKLSVNFYTRPIKLGRKFLFRQFIKGSANIGFNRPIGKELVLNNRTGLTGIYQDYIKGMRNYVINLETDVYPTFKVVGFSSSVFAFADIAIVQQNSIASFQLTQAYGAGIRLRHLGMGIDYFEFKFAYYPKLDIAGLKPYSIIGDFNNNRAITKDNLFVPKILTTDDVGSRPDN